MAWDNTIKPSELNAFFLLVLHFNRFRTRRVSRRVVAAAFEAVSRFPLVQQIAGGMNHWNGCLFLLLLLAFVQYPNPNPVTWIRISNRP